MIRFYIDGTAGQKDGTEVTSINPITATGLFPSGSTAASKMDTADGNNNLRLVCNTQSGQVDIYQGHAATDAEHALMIHSPLQFWYSAAIERETPDVTAVPFA